MEKTPTDFEILELGERYPGGSFEYEGAVTEFLRPWGNSLLINFSNINRIEAKAFKQGEMYAGLLVDQGHICFIWQFKVNNKAIVTFEGIYDARKPTDLQLPDMDDPAHFMVINVIAIDKTTEIVKALRTITIPPKMTQRFVQAVNVQLTGFGGVDGPIPQSQWMAYEPHELADKIKMIKLGTNK